MAFSRKSSKSILIASPALSLSVLPAAKPRRSNSLRKVALGLTPRLRVNNKLLPVQLGFWLVPAQTTGSPFSVPVVIFFSVPLSLLL